MTDPSSSDIPQSVRIRCDDGNEFRFDAIQRAADLYDENRSDAVARACRDVDQLADACAAVLAREDLTHEQRQEIADRLSAGYLTFDWSADDDGIDVQVRVE